MIRCREAQRRLLARVDHELAVERELELEAHLAACEVCAQLARKSNALEEAFALLPEAPLERLDLDAQVASVMGRLERPAAPVGWRVRIAPRWALAAALLLALSTLIGLAWWLGVRHGEQTNRSMAQGEPVSDPERVPPLPRPSPGVGEPAQADAESMAQSAASAAPDPAPEPVAEIDPETHRLASSELPSYASEPQAPSDSGFQPDVADQPDDLAQASPPEVAPPVTFIEPDPDELARAQEARSTLRATLVGAPLGLFASQGEVETFAKSLDARWRELGFHGFSLVRLTQHALDDPDADVARRAARYLGARGDRLAFSALEKRIDPSDLGCEAALALCDAGPVNEEALARVLSEGRVQACVVERVRADPRFDQAGLFSSAIRRVARGSSESEALAPLTDALATAEGGAVAELFELHVRGTLSRERALELVLRSPTASAELAALAVDGRLPDGRLFGEALASVGRPEAFVALAQRVRERRGRAEALAALQSAAHGPALRELFELWREGRILSKDLTGPLVVCSSREPAAARDLIEEYEAREDAEVLREWFEVLSEHEGQSVAGVLAHLASCPALGSEDRQWAALAAGERGTPAQARELADLFGELGPREKRLAAAALLGAHRAGGRAVVEPLLLPAEASVRERIREFLDHRDNGSTSLVALARLLEPLLAARALSQLENP